MQRSFLTITRMRAPPVSIDTILSSNHRLMGFSVFPEGEIQMDHGALQAAFSHMYIGGGVLNTGCAQEEIRLCISPECLISMLVCDRMADNEAILMVSVKIC